MAGYHDASAAGMMEGCFFVPRTELLQWLRNDFNLSLAKVEQCATGAVYLQVVDRLFPGKVPMHKVGWGYRHSYDFVKNYKVLQEVFEKCGVKKNVEIDKLIRGKYQDNLEFLQWLKCLYDRNNGGGQTGYAAVARRHLGFGVDWSKPLPSYLDWLRPADSSKAGAEEKATATTKVGGVTRRSDVENAAPAAAALLSRGAATSTTRGPKMNAAELQKRVKELEEQLEETAETAEAAAAESAFYFKKLRDIELICTAPGCESVASSKLTEILYAEEEESPAAAADGAAAAGPTTAAT